MKLFWELKKKGYDVNWLWLSDIITNCNSIKEAEEAKKDYNIAVLKKFYRGKNRIQTCDWTSTVWVDKCDRWVNVRSLYKRTVGVNKRMSDYIKYLRSKEKDLSDMNYKNIEKIYESGIHFISELYLRSKK